MTQAGTIADSYLAAAGHCLPTEAALHRAGLPAGQLASITLSLVRLSPSGKWHPVPAGGISGCCPAVRRAAEAGRNLIRREAAVLAGPGLCKACTARVRLPGLPGLYLTVARHVLGARHWLSAFEAAAVQDWPNWVRWTAKTPFGTPAIPAALKTLTRDQTWEPAATAAQAAWTDLADRAAVASELAGEIAGPPGMHAHAAAARAIAGGADSRTCIEADTIGAISAPISRDAPLRADAWTTASQAWADEFRLDADHAAARTALADALELLYHDAPVRDLSLLPERPSCSGADFVTLADWAAEEYLAMRQSIAGQWADRLEHALAGVADDDENAASRWRLLLITGWPLTATRDQDLAYLARYPQIDRVDVRPHIAAADREGIIRATVLLHVPGFAARHAAAHASPFFRAAAGAILPRDTSPAPSQVAELVQQAARTQPPRHPAGRGQ